MSEVENQTEEAVEETTLTTMPGADNHPLDEDQAPGMSLDFSQEEPEAKVEEEPEAKVEEEPEPEAEPEPVEAEATEEVEAQAEPEPEPAPEKKSPMIPKARLDEALQKQKALQKQLDSITKERSEFSQMEMPSKDYDFAAKELEYQELLMDGEAQKAADLRLEINAKTYEQVLWDVKAATAEVTDEKINETNEFNALQQKAIELAAIYPSLDETSDNHDPEALSEVIELRNNFIQNGYEASAALEKAVKYVTKANDIKPVTDATTAQAKPVDEVAKKRAQVQKKLDVANSQPPEMAGESSHTHGEKTPDVASMSEEEFAALPEATLARLRGDIL